MPVIQPNSFPPRIPSSYPAPPALPPLPSPSPLKAVPAPVSTPTEGELRGVLRKANTGREEALKVRDAAREVDARAKASLEKAQEANRKAQSVSSNLLAWKAEQMRSGAHDPAPPNLLEARREAFVVQEESQHSEAVASQMASELALAEGKVKAAEQAVGIAHANVVLAVCETMVVEIESLSARREHLRRVFRGVHALNQSQQQLSLLTGLMFRVMSEDGREQLAYPQTAPGSTRFWKQFNEDLAADPDAVLGEPPAPDGLWI